MLNLTHQALGDGKKLPSEPLWIVSANGPVEFDVEVARTDQQKARGLMFRRSLPQGKGMLFTYKAAANHTMWMRNTYIPLDMIFIRVDGRVHRIEARTEPFSERIIAAGAPVTAVLEIAGGEAERLGLRPGDLVRHAWFGTADD